MKNKHPFLRPVRMIRVNGVGMMDGPTLEERHIWEHYRYERVMASCLGAGMTMLESVYVFCSGACVSPLPSDITAFRKRPNDDFRYTMSPGLQSLVRGIVYLNRWDLCLKWLPPTAWPVPSWWQDFPQSFADLLPRAPEKQPGSSGDFGWFLKA